MEDKRPDSVARLLVVEDEPLIAEDLRLRLEELQYDVVGIAADGQRAVEMAGALNPDLVLMDIVLEGETDGIQTAERIRRLYGLPVIFVTAYTDQEFLDRAKSIEPFGYIVKPVRTRELHAVVSMALYRARLERQLDELRWGSGVCDHLSDGVVVIDRAGQISYMNAAARGFIAGGADVSVGQDWHDGLLAAEPARLLDITGRLNHVFKTGQREIINEDFRLHGKGDERDVRIKLIPVGERVNAPLGVAVVLTDVTEQRRAKAALQRAATLAQVTPQGIFRTDAEGRCSYVNSRWSEITGLSEKQALGTSWTRFVDAGDRESIAKQWHNVLQYDMEFNRQCHFRRGETTRCALVRMAAEHDDDGRMIGFVGSLNDITDLRETQEALLDREQAYADLLSNLTGMVYRCRNDESWSMSYVSDGCERLTGWSSEDLIDNKSTSFNELIHPDDREKLWQSCQSSLAARKPCSNEYRIIRRDNATRWVWDQSNGRYDETGKLVEIEGIITDISTRKFAEEQLALNKAEFEAVFNAIPDAIIFTDIDRTIQAVNPAVKKLFGYDAQELHGHTTEILYTDSDAYLEQGKRRFRADAVSDTDSYEMFYRRKDGSEFIGETIGVVLRDAEGDPVGMLGVIRDITERKEAADEMQRALQQLQALYNASPDMVFMHGIDGRLIDVNENALREFGYSRDEILQLNVEKISGSGCSQEMAVDAIKRTSGEGSVDLEWTAKRHDGSEFPVEVRLRRLEGLSDPGGVSVVAVVRDLTDRIEAEKTLEQERDFSTAILDTIGSVVVVLDRSGAIVRFNRAAQRLTGYSEDQVLGRCVWDFLLLPEERKPVEAVFHRLTAGDFPSQYENNWVTKNGEFRLLSWNNSALLDEQGNVEYVIATGIDLTQQRRAERDLAVVEMQWNEVIDFLSDPVYLVGLDDKVIRANRAFYKLTGKIPEDVLGKDITDIMHPQGEVSPCPVCAARIARNDTTVVLEADHPSNPLNRPIEVSIRIIRDNQSAPLGILMGIRDLSNQRTIEAELREHRDNLEKLVQQRTAALENANRELEAFSYSVSHDLRAPLRGIDGFSQALLDEYSDRIDAVGQDYLHRVRRASQRLGLLIDDMLELSRVGRDRIEYKWVDLSKLALSVLKELQEGEPEQQLRADIQPDLRVCGDPVLLRLMMQNLLGNAWKFSSVREVSEIRFGMSETETESGRRVFFVSDNGVGFDMAYADKLFGAFQRLHSTQEFEGTGVGLATVQRIVHRHEGEIWAESAINEGATFYFTLPEHRCSRLQ